MADLIVLTFDTPYGGTRALAGVRALEELHYAWIDDVAVIEKHKAGFVTIHSPHGSPATGAWLGGLLGLLLFWWFPPAWFFGGWLAGLGIGALIGEAMAKAGLDKPMVEEIKSELKPGTSALLLMGARGDVDEMSRAFEQYHPTHVLRYEIGDDVIEKLKVALGTGEETVSAGSANADK
ncbi:MAG: putative rane protein [Actinomycetia bacterium]|jgi:uncharacterized membrane protein|nr:putative rane protein [Actinomycetes bacterium]